MKKIDRETVQRILDSADIVDVVSDFVSLKRRGANYIGLCPFHNERTPSFSVSKTKGICKCFSCGKGGSPVNFIMEIEQLSYQEALRYLAKKYNIEIVEHEMSDEERQQESQRESMLTLNSFAMEHFETNLTETEDGRDIGLAYFRKRGINDAMIKRFHLGFSMEQGNKLYNAAIAKGYNEKYLIDTGLCIRNERGTVYDRFKGRVMYPVHGISGKVVAFGGRTLRSDKSVAKYVNSPESVIYSKSRELYGLYQAKQAIARKNKCILVEGYMDVISMHQAGVENVVASSGTSLTDGQVRLIHRFTDNVTVIYDSDPAGIKASLRGIDMILAEGINVKVLSLPDGDDPDSFAQSHSAEEVERYLTENEVDFIKFKTDILLKDAAGDPIARSRVISDILKSISVIPDTITRSVYVAECSRAFGISEQVLMLQLSKMIAKNIEEHDKRNRQQQAQDSIKDIVGGDATATPTTTTDETPQSQPETQTPQKLAVHAELDERTRSIMPFEHEIIRLVTKYGFMKLCDGEDDNGNVVDINVATFVNIEFGRRKISFTVPIYAKIFEAIKDLESEWLVSRNARIVELQAQTEDECRDEIAKLTSDSLISKEEILKIERLTTEKYQAEYTRRLREYDMHYIEQRLCSDTDDEIRRVATDLVSERHKLSKIHSKFSKVESELDRLVEVMTRALSELYYGIVNYELKEINRQLKEATDDANVDELLHRYIELKHNQQKLAKAIGDRIISSPI